MGINTSKVLNYEFPNTPIRFINFNNLKIFSNFPKYSTNNKESNISIDYSNMSNHDIGNSLFVFISHTWLHGYQHDHTLITKENDISKCVFHLIIEGIEKIIKTYTIGIESCYVWLDSGCLDLDNNEVIN